MIKKINTIIASVAALMLLTLVSCKKDGAMVVATSGTQPGLTASTQQLKYTIADSNSTAITFNYTPNDFGYQAAINYSLEFSYNDAHFSKVSTYSLTQKSMAFTVHDFNTLALGMKYAAGVSDTVLVRVKAQAADSLFKYSDTLAILISPYAQPRVINYPFLYVPGGYQGWDFGTSSSYIPAIIAKVYSAQNNNVYDGYVNITDTSNGNNQFKFSNQTGWGGSNYGSSDNVVGGGTLSTAGNAGNLTVKLPGYYLLHADIPNLKWTATLQSWSIIGDFNSWSGDAPFTFNDSTQTLEATLSLTIGGIKFRLNKDWGTSYGIKKDPADASGKTDLPISPLGEVPIATSNNDNIPITVAGTYKITLDLRVPSEPYCTIIKQ